MPAVCDSSSARFEVGCQPGIGFPNCTRHHRVPALIRPSGGATLQRALAYRILEFLRVLTGCRTVGY